MIFQVRFQPFVNKTNHIIIYFNYEFVTASLSEFKELTVFFNKETDLLAWKAVNRQRRENTTLGVFFPWAPGYWDAPHVKRWMFTKIQFQFSK